MQARRPTREDIRDVEGGRGTGRCRGDEAVEEVGVSLREVDAGVL